MINYNSVKENKDIEMGTLFGVGDYICEVDDFNYDTPNESIVFIYGNYEDFLNGVYLETISLLNENIRENIKEYIEENYESNCGYEIRKIELESEEDNEQD